VPRAGLVPAVVTEAGAVLADEVGFDQLSMGLVAERLGVKTPSLYKHVTGQADLAHRIAVLASTELGDAVGDAIQGRSGRDALAAAAQALRSYVKEHPGRYAAANSARSSGPDDPLTEASRRTLAPLAAVLRGYDLPPAQEVHALRMLRSVLHGFVTLEVSAAFQLETDIDDSFGWLVDFIDHGLHAMVDPQRRTVTGTVPSSVTFPERTVAFRTPEASQ
jgi:AcrR family transcriptional regulator